MLPLKRSVTLGAARKDLRKAMKKRAEAGMRMPCVRSEMDLT